MHTHCGTFELRERARPVPEGPEVVVQVHSCGICGSDLHVTHGAFPSPAVCLGHEISGTVVAVGHDVDTVTAGDRVAVEPLVVCRECAYCRTGDYQLCRRFQLIGTSLDGGFAEYVRVPGYAVYRLPADIDFAVGALTEPLAVAVHGVRLGGVGLGDRVLVLGAGTIGLLCVVAARAAGASDVWITARYPHQGDAALALGATRVFTGVNAAGELATAGQTQPIDIVIETVGGTADTLGTAVDVVRPGGTVSVLGVFTNAPVLNALALVVREVRLVGSLTYGRPGPRTDFDVALQLLAARPETFRSLITHRFSLSEINRAFSVASDKHSGAIKVAIQPAIKAS